MSFIDAFLNVLAILGIIVAGGFLVFFLGDLLLSILEPRHKTVYKEKDEDFSSKSFNKEETFTMENEEQPSTISDEKFTMDDEEIAPVNYDEAESEQKSLGIMPEQTKEVKAEKDEDINSLFNDNDDFNFDDNFDFDKLFDEEDKTVKAQTAEEVAKEDILPILPATV